MNCSPGSTPDSGHDYGLCSRAASTLTINPRPSWYAFQALDKSWPIEARFSAAPTSGPLPLAVQFADQSWYPGATGWSWEFGDGQVSTERNPLHTYKLNGLFAVRLTVNGPSGPVVYEQAGCVQAGVLPPVPGLDNPSFEDNGGSLAGWQVVRVSGEGPDTPPLSNSNTFGPRTPAGTHFAGKITSWMRMDFYLGQVVGTSGWLPAATLANWRLSALVQMHCSQQGSALPTGVHERWEIGWNDDGSEPASIMDCDHYQAVADLDGTYTVNNGQDFRLLSRTGTISGVAGLRGVALRVRCYNDNAWTWSFANLDMVTLEVASASLAIPGDFAHDGDVDEDDVAFFAACAGGPGVLPSGTDCPAADLDGDHDADSEDFGLLQRCLSGRDRPGDPACAS